MNEISNIKPHLVLVGTQKFYCDSFSFSTAAHYSTKNDINGKAALTNKGPSRVDIAVNCRYYKREKPLSYCTAMVNNCGGQTYTVKYRDIEFRNCTVTECSITDDGGDCIGIRFRASTISTVLTGREEPI